jgi:hypothetical protein
MILGSLFLTTCSPSLLGPRSVDGGKSGISTTYGVGVSVAWGVADGLGVLVGKIDVAEGNKVGCRGRPLSWCSGDTTGMAVKVAGISPDTGVETC